MHHMNACCLQCLESQETTIPQSNLACAYCFSPSCSHELLDYFTNLRRQMYLVILIHPPWELCTGKESSLPQGSSFRKSKQRPPYKTELQQKFKSHYERVLEFKIRALVVNKWDPVTWGGDMWENPTEAENFEPSGSQGFISRLSNPWNTAFSTFDWGN